MIPLLNRDKKSVHIDVKNNTIHEKLGVRRSEFEVKNLNYLSELISPNFELSTPNYLQLSKNPYHLSNNGDLFFSLFDDNGFHLGIGWLKPDQIPLLKDPLDGGFIFD